MRNTCATFVISETRIPKKGDPIRMMKMGSDTQGSSSENDPIRMMKMGSDTQGSSSENEQDSQEAVDVDLEQNMETFSLYRMKSSKCEAVVTVRQLRFKGLSFQLWPTAHAVCWYVEHEFGAEGMQVREFVIDDPSVSPCSDLGSHDRLPRALANRRKDGGHTKKNSCDAEALVVEVIRSSLPVLREAGKSHPEGRRMRVLELGAGTGLVGIVAACLGAHVVLTDLPHVIPNISHNLDLNREIIEAGGGSAEAKVLRWGVEDDVKALLDLSFDLILVSDCVYYDTLYKPLLQTLKWVMSKDWTSVCKKECTPMNLSVLTSDYSSQPLTPNLMPFTSTIRSEVNANQTVQYIETAGQSVHHPAARVLEMEGSGSTECVIFLGHMRRWKKDVHFFRMASKCFHVQILHRHPPEENARIGPIVYLLTSKS